MKFTRQELIEKIKKNNVSFFRDLYYEGSNDEMENKHEVVYDQHYGDGNEWNIAFSFPEENLFVLMEGYYSSHDSSEFDKVSFAAPFEFKETRYKAMTQEEIRDMNIETVIR
jgi:hypothetical protein